MKLLNSSLILIFTLSSMSLFACGHGFFPKSQTYSSSNTKAAVNKNIIAANLVELFQEIYSPIFAKEDKTLNINFKWEETQLNAYATRDDNNNPIINITGGLIAHDLIDRDSLSLIICHEIGHFLGGSPKKLRGRSTKKSWSSAEGQADYYATAFCLKKVFMRIPKEATRLKSNRYQQESSQICRSESCKRIAMASLNVARVYAEIDFFSNELSLIYKDDYTVYETIYGHSNPQCRLDTMISGLLCPSSESIEFKDSDQINSACSSPKFRRPRCWFYPKDDSN